MSLKDLRFTLEVDGQRPDTPAILSFRLIQNQSYPSMMSVDVVSGSFMQTVETLLEKKTTLTTRQNVIPWRYVAGVVTGFGMQENNGQQMRYHLCIEPPLWRCGLRQNFHIFQQQDIRTIPITLLNENGVTEWTPLFREDRPVREFRVQYEESDLAFLARLWTEEGILFFEWFAADSPEQKLTLCDDVTGLSQAGEFPFNPDVSTGAEMGCVSMSRYEAHVRPSSVQSQGCTFKVPDWPGMYEQQGENLNGQLEQYEIFDYPGRFRGEQHDKGFTLYQMESLRGDVEKATGQSNSPKLWPGAWLALTGHPQKILNCEQRVVQGILSGDQPQVLHGNQGRGATLGNQLEMIPTDRVWRPQVQSKPEVDGPQGAIMTGSAGEETFCNERGQVRVKLRQGRYHGMTEESSCWVRVSRAWAGLGSGNLTIPCTGQKVVVDFLNRNPDQPITMGRAYREDNRSSGSLPGMRTRMVIRPKAYKGSGFNELCSENVAGKKEIYLHVQKNMQIVVLNSEDKRVNYDWTVSIGYDEFLVVTNDRKVTTEGKQGHETTKGHVNPTEGSQGLEVKGDLAQKISGALGISVQDDIVLRDDNKISLRVGGSFAVVHSGGVDIKDAKINLNGGGSLGDVILPMRPVILKAATGNGSMPVAYCPKEDK